MVTIDDYANIQVNDEIALKKVVVNQLVSVVIERSGRAFQLYELGIFSGSCGIYLDHGVTIVGYGFKNGKFY